jgi:PKD repeat protein
MALLGLGLFAGGADVQAAGFLWTNTTGAVFNDPNAWSPIGGPGGPLDTATITVSGPLDIPLTNNFANIGFALFGAGSGSGTLNLTLDLGTNTFAGLSGNTTSASGFVFGQQGTSIVYIAGGTILCTNAAASPSNARLIVGRNGPATVNLTNGVVVDGNLVIANGTGANGSKVVVSGPNSFWSNQTTIAVGNGAATAFNSMVVSNSGSIVALSTIQVGNGGFFNSLLLDTGGRLFTRNTGSIGSSAGSSNNTVTIQGGAVWECGGRQLFIGNASGFNNVFTIGSNGTVTNATFAFLTAAGNSLVLSGGLLKVTGGVTNTSGTVSGFGTIVGNVGFANAGTLSPGFGNSVGALTFSNNLTLASTSTTVLKLDKNQAGSNDLLTVAGTAGQAGKLAINNVGAALVGGDTFKVLAFTGQSGNFGPTNLTSLTGTLIWDTTQLGPQGVISVDLPPTITGPDPQAVFTNTNVTISTVVTSVPAPGLQWQLGGVNVVDGPTGNGSTISGSTSGTLTILNAQVADGGQYCLIASNFAGSVTNCMTLEVTTNTAAPLIGGPKDQNVISPNSATFLAVVVGIPTPTQQWQDNGVDISGATNTSLIIPGVTYALDGHVYSIIASNSVGTTTNSAVLHVVVPPAIAVQPQSVTVTNTQSASFTVLSTNGVPAPTYQWYFNNVLVGGSTNATYTIPSATPANVGAYHVIVANVVGSVTSTDATLTVLSTMSGTLTPSNSAVNVCYDTPLYLTFDRVPVSRGTGKIQIFNATNNVTPVDTIDTSLGNLQPRTIGTESFNTFPVIITNNTVAIYPHLGVMSSNQTYYVTVDQGTFADTNGALFAGITATNAWQFTTKSAPAIPSNLMVAFDGNGDFCTVQGALDSLPNGNTTYTLVNIRNGTYTEIVSTRNKNNVTFRGQSRSGTVVGYTNNNNNNGSTHFRMAFKVYSNDIAIENMTLVNTTPQGGSQAEALMIESGAARFIMYNADLNSRQDTILANLNSSQGYFFKSLIRGNFDYIWGGGNLFFTNCEMRTIPTASSYNLTAPRTDNGPTPPGWLGPDGRYASNGFSIVDCLLTRSDNTVSNMTPVGSNGAPDGNAAFIKCHIDTSLYVPPSATITNSYILWQYDNSNLTDTASASLGLTVLTNGDARLVAASSASIWLYGWSPQLAPNILTNPVNVTVAAGQLASFSVSATGIPDPTYQWLKNGTNVVSGTNATLNISPALAGDAGVYSVIVSNIAGAVTSTSATLTVTGTAAVASFTASPTSGTEPLGVTFTDTSSGSPNITLFWDFGNGTSSTTGGASFVHSYAAGTYTVTLTASNAFGANSTLVSNNLITAITAFQAWQQQYFNCTGCPQADPNADPLGKGIDNMNQFLLGLNPTNPASVFRITSVVTQGGTKTITWSTAGVRTNVVQGAVGDGSGGYSNNFSDISGPIVIGVPGDTSASYADSSGTNNYYRIRLGP